MLGSASRARRKSSAKASAVSCRSGVPSGTASRPGDVVVECGAAERLPDEDLALVDAVVGQLLAFFRCLHAGLRPDSPSEAGIINRVVQSFAIHEPS